MTFGTFLSAVRVQHRWREYEHIKSLLTMLDLYFLCVTFRVFGSGKQSIYKHLKLAEQVQITVGGNVLLLMHILSKLCKSP